MSFVHARVTLTPNWPAPIRWPRFEVSASSVLELAPFVVHDLCKFSGCDSLVGEGSGRQAAQGRMRSVVVVVAPPVLDALAGISQREATTRRSSTPPVGGR